MRLDHINIKAPQELIEQVREFYCAVLGLEEGFRPGFVSPGYWLYAAEQPVVHLSVEPHMPVGGVQGHLDHVAFRAEGLEGFRARLQASGVGFRSSYLPESDLTQLFLRDPAGTGLEINFVGEVLQ